MSVIVTEGLSKTYHSGLFGRQQIHALAPTNISIEKGEIFGLLGPNGAGKTTFIKLLLSIIFPSSGRTEILGHRITDYTIKEKIGYLPENHRYPSYLTGEQVLSFFGKLSGLTPGELRPRIDELLKLVDMTQWRRTKIKKYSKGMLQRIGLAQALLNNPEIVFLDEPTDGVDPIGRKEIRDILRRIRDEGKTVFLNSHLLSEVELISDRVGVLNKGVLIKTGTIDALTRAPEEYLFRVSEPISGQIETELASQSFTVTQHDQGYFIRAENVGQLNSIIDILRKHGVQIESIVPHRTTLEESFISLIQSEVPK
jgi:ABC-2 type transport system ATP-binding protein